jgi:hypothetical protein
MRIASAIYRLQPLELSILVDSSWLGPDYVTSCAGMLLPMPEAIIPSTWVSAPSWTAGPEWHGWLTHGSWAAAVQTMRYETWNYAYCSGVCKVLLDPNSDMLFQVGLNLC